MITREFSFLTVVVVRPRVTESDVKSETTPFNQDNSPTQAFYLYRFNMIFNED